MKAESGKRKEKQSTIMKEEKSYRSAFALVFLTMVTKGRHQFVRFFFQGF